MDNNLSSADLLTLQVLERELIEPNISKDYERGLRTRMEYLRTTRPTESVEMTYTYKDIEDHRTLLNSSAETWAARNGVPSKNT